MANATDILRQHEASPSKVPGKSSLASRLAPWIAALAAWLVVILILLPPYVGVGPRAIIMSAFSNVCHQIPTRSVVVDGVPLAVCHRCLGIFTGLAVATVLFAFLIRFRTWVVQHARTAIVLCLTPLALDWGLDITGLWTNTPSSRTLTGSVFGLTMGAMLIGALTKTVRDSSDDDRSVVHRQATRAESKA